MKNLRKLVKRWFRSHGYEVRKLSLGELDDITRLVKLCEAKGIKTFLDVGANQGQFGTDLRVAGYDKRLISFEPLSQAYSLLTDRAASDPNWLVAPRCAIGREEGQCVINVSENSFSSSLLPMKEVHALCAPSSGYVGEEQITVKPLSSILRSLNVSAVEQLALKIDTQGYEAEVLAGAEAILPKVEVIFTEFSLLPLYDGAPEFQEMYNLLMNYGYRCVALSHEFSDPRSGEMLQVNGTFVKR